jgi:hypothetical protein
VEDNFTPVDRAEIRFLYALDHEVAASGKLPVRDAVNDKGVRIGRRVDEYLFKASRRTLPLVISLYLDQVPGWREALAGTSPLTEVLRRRVEVLMEYMNMHQGKLPPEGYITPDGDKLGSWTKRNLVRSANRSLEWWLDEALTAIPGWNRAVEKERKARRGLVKT